MDIPVHACAYPCCEEDPVPSVWDYTDLAYLIMNKIEKIFQENQVYDLEGNKHPLDSNISLKESLELYNLLIERKPQQTVEVGFAKGVSALTILSAKKNMENGMHHVIDPFQKGYDYCGLAMVKRLGLERGFTFHEKFPEEVIPSLDRIDFAFIDASHIFDLSLMEFVLVDKKLSLNGVIGFHDLWMPSLQKLLRYILKNRNYRVINQRNVDQGRGAKGLLTNTLNKSKKLQRYFSSELLEPFSAMGIPNMVFIEKMGNDTREWTYHAKF